MPHDPQKFLRDMLDRAVYLREVLDGRTPDDLRQDRLLRSAVEREFSINGEALIQLHRLAPHIAEKIDHWQDIIGFRHVLVHGYGRVEMETIVDVTHKELPLLVRQVTEFLESLDKP